MRRPLRLYFAVLLGTLLFPASRLALAESGILVVHVKDVQRRPIAGIRIGVEGDGGSSITADDGKARIALAKNTTEKSRVSLQILTSPPGKDFVMVSPWDYKTLVPSFENESENFVDIVVVQRGDRVALESGTVLKALTEKINNANAPKSSDKQSSLESQKAALATVAGQYGLTPDDLDQAIRAWGAKATDPYEAGMAALYERNFAKASTQLSESLQKREDKYAADQKAVADAACFLGQSLYEEGRYRDSVAPYQRCLQLRPDDSAVLTDAGLNLMEAGDYAAAEALLRSALANVEHARGSDDANVAVSLSNLAAALKTSGDYPAAESLLRRALGIDQKYLGPDDPRIATVMNNLAAVLKAEGDYVAAEPLYRHVLEIDEKTPEPGRLNLANSRYNLGKLLLAEGNYVDAEPLLRSALEIAEKALGPEHPRVATCLNGLAEALGDKRDFRNAEALYRRALEIDEKALGPYHRDIATNLNNLALVLQAEGDYKGAEPLLRRALSIFEKALGPSHPEVAKTLNNSPFFWPPSRTMPRPNRFANAHSPSKRRLWGRAVPKLR
jgi:tetratricopeptide (TPR) repeat protein